MKFINTALLLTLSLPFAKCNSKECVTDYEEGKDYFPIKVKPIESEKWSVTYENSYKIVKNLAGDKSYLLYQCGTPQPETVEGSYDAVVPVVSFFFFLSLSLDNVLCSFAQNLTKNLLCFESLLETLEFTSLPSFLLSSY